MNRFKSLMLKAAIILVALFALHLPSATPVAALDFTVTLSTHVPTAGATEFADGSYPSHSGAHRIRNIILTNAGATAQVVSIYDTCTSSSAAVLAGVVDLPAAIGAVQLPPGNAYLPDVWRLTSPCIKKSATGSAVQATVLYE